MIKSPLNYIGGKYKLLPQILPLFPKNINTFVDLFAGGLDVSLNVDSNFTISNDINYYVIGLYEYFKRNPLERLLNDIHYTIQEYRLSKENIKGFYALRDKYNETHSSLFLFLLICFGFNHQIRFNGNGEFNNPFGKNRSSYNVHIEKNLCKMHEKLKNIEFHISNFRNFKTDFMKEGDFLYADPPYLISCGSYNDGKRGFEGWSQNDDVALLEKLDNLEERGLRFALSNVLKHKGAENKILVEWAKRYNIHYLNASYANSNYQATKRETIEVLITNY